MSPLTSLNITRRLLNIGALVILGKVIGKALLHFIYPRFYLDCLALLINQTFCEQFLIPLEENDQRMQLDVQHIHVRDYIKMLKTGNQK